MDQLPPAVWLQLLLLIAGVFVLVFGGAWVLRWFFNRGRTGEITDDEHPDNTLTVAIGPGRLAPSRPDSCPSSTVGSVRQPIRLQRAR